MFHPSVPFIYKKKLNFLLLLPFTIFFICNAHSGTGCWVFMLFFLFCFALEPFCIESTMFLFTFSNIKCTGLLKSVLKPLIPWIPGYHQTLYIIFNVKLLKFFGFFLSKKTI